MKQPARMYGAAQAFCLLCALTASVYAQPVRLAIITTDKAQEPVADLLTVELSKQEGLTLLERAEVNRILAEQRLSATAAGNYVKLGQLLAGVPEQDRVETDDAASGVLSRRRDCGTRSQKECAAVRVAPRGGHRRADLGRDGGHARAADVAVCRRRTGSWADRAS